MTDAAAVAAFLDGLLHEARIDDYGGAINGLQMSSGAPITKIAAAVDFSLRTLNQCIENDANFLIVHHGMFWGGTIPFVGAAFTKMKLLCEKQVAVFSSHLPLDMHPEIGNNALLAKELGLNATRGFANWKGSSIGVAGDSDIPTSELAGRAESFAARYGGKVVTTSNVPGRTTRKWGMCTGAGASAETLEEARSEGIDTLVVGEGPHWTSVAAEDADIAIIYAGHYATETLGVQAAAKRASEKFGIPWFFVNAPTGL